ncbi:MAG TPA: hypothetical protein VFL77_07715 [Solirubrobacterales bacterium]|nr:hypothetical protein [Solirubrobacterales bacterium]
MRKHLMLTMALLGLIAVSAAGVASAAGGGGPVTAEAGNIKFTFDGGFSPTKLPKKKMAPIVLTASGKIQTKDGSHPPALKTVEVESDKNGTINTKGVPVCKSGQLQSRDTKAAEKVCGSAIIGTGTTSVEIQFPEQNPIPVNSKLLVFNGGTSGGKTTLFIHAYITVPTPAAIVTTVKIKKIHKGRYGLLSVASVPKIAGGSGSVKSFSLKVGNKKKVLSAKCPDGKLQAHATAIFADGTKASAAIVRTCTGT